MNVLASTSRDQRVRLWNASKGQELQEFENMPDVSAINDNTILTNRGAVTIDQEPSAGMSLESSTNQANMIMNDWIQRKSRNFLWPPHEYRSARLVFCDGMFAFGLHSGLVNPNRSVLNTLSIMGLLISTRSAFREAHTFDHKWPHVSATRKHHDRKPS